VTSYFSFGSFGVGLFFLISGFVIPFSFRKQSRAGFLAGRVLRLWPTYAAGLTVTLSALLGGALLEGRPFPYTGGHVALHYVLGVRDLLWLPSIDGIVWTLEIEIKFYWLCALLAPWLAAGRRRVFAVVPVLVGTVLLLSGRYDEWLAEHPRRWAAAWVATVDAQMIVYMLIGTAFHYLYRGWVRPWAGAAMAAVLFGQSTLCAFHAYARESSGVVAVSYGAALAVFAACYVFRERFRGGGVTGWLADISYPLYAVHGMAGYVLMNLLVRRGVPAEATLAIGLAAAVGAAWLLHVTVEKPTHRLATRVARALSPAAKPAEAGREVPVVKAA
jgi:peptidoglycan/LPS O-acetylase OafA/YrhL